MTDAPQFYNLPSDVTVESTAFTSERSSTSRIPEDLLDAVGKQEQSFERALNDIIRSDYLPTKYIGEVRSNLHKQFEVSASAPKESDKLLGSSSSSSSYTEKNFIDDFSIRTEEQSLWSKTAFETKQQNSLPSSASPVENVEVEAVAPVTDEPQTETPKLESQKLETPKLESSEIGLSKHELLESENEDDFPIERFGCETLKMEIHKNLKQHRLACNYFRFRNFFIFQFPQAILAVVSSILAFMGGSDVFDCFSQKWFTTIAGCCSATVVFLQTLSGYCSYGLRASMHEGTAIYLRDLDDDLTLLISKLIKTEMIEKNKSENQELMHQRVQSNEDSFESLQSRYRHSLKGCKSDVPTQITEAFSEIDSFILLSRTTANRNYLRECGMFESQNFRGITLKSYDRLASNMVGHYYWPMKIPSSKDLVKRTIEETRYDLHQMHSFWENPSPKNLSTSCVPLGNDFSDKNIRPKFVTS